MPAMRAPVHHLALAAALVAALAAPLPAAAFGSSGHRLAGHVAERYLCAETRVALEPLLAGLTLAEAGLWPDTIRRRPEWEHTKPWHYLDVSDHGSVARAARRNPDNVLAALARFETELGDTALSNQLRGLALRFVVHFVVDIHQPLHVGRESDRGGNLIPVLVAGRETNLHALWDGELLRPPGNQSARERAGFLPLPAATSVLRWQRASPLDWARESQALRSGVYGFSGRGGRPVTLQAAYLDRARRVVDQRLLMAGVRLAGRLNSIFAVPPGCGAEVATR
jgi:hypothetical protein